MDMSAGSDVTDKPWEHAWTTEEMRKNRADWSLAGDAGLLRHLQQFSDNLMARANKTRETLDTLNAQLDETAIFIDNVTNTSLALANTQFIESRVYEDDVEIEKPQEQQPQESKSNQQIEAELIASIGESVRQGLAIMDEKYERLEVVPSDSEDEGEPAVPSIILRPKDPYQDRPLPYVIDSEEWKASSRVGLESSSSDSEQQEEDESDSSVSNEEMAIPVPKPISLHNPRIPRLSSSSSESNDAPNISSRHTNDDKVSAKNQDIFDSDSGTTTAVSSLPKNASSAAPSFAEELAKRLGSVAPVQKSINTQEVNEPFIHQTEDDIFTPEDDEDLFSSKTRNLFTREKGLFDEEPSNSMWDDESASPSKSNVIPPSIDGPPPMSSVSTKPKLAIDDLFGDAESQDSDDIFSPKNSMDKQFKKSASAAGESQIAQEKLSKRLLSVGTLMDNSMMTTSTPETNNIGKGLFDDEVKDESEKRNDWMGAKGSTPDKSAGPSLADVSDPSHKKKPVGGISIFGQVDIFASDFGSKLSNKFRRRSSSDSSSSEATTNCDSANSNKTNTGDGGSASVHGNSADGSSVIAGGNAENTIGSVETSGSSGISLQPPSNENTAGSSMSRDFQASGVVSSTRLKSDDIYRERISSDSLFTTRSRMRGSMNSANNSNQLREERIDEVSVSQDDVSYNNDDIFGPPPLSKSGSKSKSKVASLFDDSDSGDDLFSNTSSGSRSQLSADLLATTPQSLEKVKPLHKKGLFDDDSDLFGSKESPDVDIFRTSSIPSKGKNSVTQRASEDSIKTSGNPFGDKKSADSSVPRKDDTESSFEKQSTVKIPETKSVSKLGSIFDDVDDDDLFSPNFGKKTTKSDEKKRSNLFDDNSDDLFSVPKGNLSSTSERDPATEILHKSEPDEKLPAKSENTKRVDSELKKESAADKNMRKEQKIIDTSSGTIPPVITTKDLDAIPTDISQNESENVGNNLFKDSGEGENLFAHKKSTKSDEYIGKKSEDKIEVTTCREIQSGQEIHFEVNSSTPEFISKPDVAQKPDILPKRVKDFGKESQSTHVLGGVPRHGISEPNMTSEFSRHKMEESQRDISGADTNTLFESGNSDELFGGPKKEPPKTLKIRSTVSLTKEELAAVPRRPVSGKIKDLMGRMGDLKIRSPTDVPPMVRKSETDEEDEVAVDKDDEDGGCISAQKESPPPLVSEKNLSRKTSTQSTPIERKNPETAVSFDVPAQVETLAVTASKSRVRIQSKRRPQSRHARQSALRHSGIDFDTVDIANDNNSDTNRNLSSNTSNNNPTAATNSSNAQNVVNSNTDKLIIPTGEGDNVNKVMESSSSIFADDRSDISFSKESSLSVNKNTLLSPSTDEEDLFDVPPDLPEDPPKEDTLFGRAPILSPIEPIAKTKEGSSKEVVKVDGSHSRPSKEKILHKDKVLKDEVTEGVLSDVLSGQGFSKDKQFKPVEGETEILFKKHEEEKKASSRRDLGDTSNRAHPDEKVLIEDVPRKGVFTEEDAEHKILDPLQDSNHDPLKDPSQLFAFVTKTPSPEKGKNLLFNEDDSLFSSVLKKPSNDKTSVSKKQTLDLFTDDAEGDIFSGPLAKPAKKPTKQSKLDLFDDDDDGDDLFGAASKEPIPKSETRNSKIPKVSEQDSSKQSSLFGGGGDVNFFANQNPKSEVESAKSQGLHKDDELFSNTGKLNTPDRISKTTKASVKDIFGDHSSGEDDIFAVKKTAIEKPTPSKSLFGDDDDDGDIFRKSTPLTTSQTKTIESRSVIKKPATRDLRKTAEKIAEDPLSMLQED